MGTPLLRKPIKVNRPKIKSLSLKFSSRTIERSVSYIRINWSSVNPSKLIKEWSSLKTNAIFILEYKVRFEICAISKWQYSSLKIEGDILYHMHHHKDIKELSIEY